MFRKVGWFSGVLLLGLATLTIGGVNSGNVERAKAIADTVSQPSVFGVVNLYSPWAATGYVYHDGTQYQYGGGWDLWIGYGATSSRTRRGFASWDITQIPPSSSIPRIDLTVYRTQGPNTATNLTVKSMEYNPSGRAASDVWTDCGDGTTYGSMSVYGVVNLNFPLPQAAIDLIVQRSQGASPWFAAGFYSTNENAGTDYTFLVEGSWQGQHNPGWRPTLAVDYVLGSVSGLTATAISPTQIRLNWNENCINEQGFWVHWWPPGDNWVRIDGRNLTSWVHNGLTPGNTYNYRVSAFTSGGATAESNQAQATTPLYNVVLQNELLDRGTYPSFVFADGVQLASPAYINWPAGSQHDISTLAWIPYFDPNPPPNPQYFCEWSEPGNQWTVKNAHRITVPEGAPNNFNARFKRRPFLTGWQVYPYNYLDWSWRPAEVRPATLRRFEACYWKSRGLLGTDQWVSFGSVAINTNSTDDGVRWENPTNGYLIKAHMQTGSDTNDVWSNAVSTTAPPPGDPLVSYSQDSLATGYPNGQKIVLDRKDRLHVVFTSSDTVYYTFSNKKAKKWSAPVAVGLGRFPAIAMDSHDSPHVLWTSGTQVFSSQLSNGVWTTPYSLFSSSGATVEAPAFVMNTANDSGFASWTVVTTTSSEVSLASFMPGDTTAPVAIQRVDSGGTTSFASPSLALDPTGKVLVSWSRDGEVYFQERGGPVLDLSDSPGALSIHPVVDAYGDMVSVTWQERDSTTGVFHIQRVLKVDGVWGTPWDLSPGTGSAVYPAVAGASQIAYSTDAPGRREVFYNGMYEDGAMLYTTLLSASSEGLAHNYPSIVLDNDWPEAKLHCVWTGQILGGIPPVKSITIIVPPVPSVFMDAGKAIPSSHTIQRAGTVTYGSQPYLTADTHPQKLIYRFTGLNPNKRYRLGVTYYFEKPGATWRMRLKVDGRDGMRTRISSGERVDDSNWVPASVYQDGVIDVEITPDAGDFALCNELALYEFNRGSGGPQVDEAGPIVELPLSYALGQSYPNPFKDNATITYQLPEEAPVSLKVFNVTGQVVRELASGKQKAGFYNAVWDGKDGSGRSVSSGVYFYRLDAGGFSKTNKLVVVR